MTSTKKKQLIVLLLALGSVLLTYLLFTLRLPDSQSQFYPEHLDTLIYRELYSFNISDQQIRNKVAYQDSLFTRIEYDIRLPRYISKTYIHSELNKEFYNHEIQTPARVIFPKKDMRIYIIHDGTVFRTLNLSTDSAMTYQQYSVSIFFLAKTTPDIEIVREIHDLGEFIPLVLQTTNPENAEKWYGLVQSKINPIYIWYNDTNESKLLHQIYSLQDRLPRFSSISSQLLTIVEESQIDDDLPRRSKSLLTTHNVKSIKSDHLIFANSENGIFYFERAVDQFKEMALRNEHPILVASLNRKSYEYLREIIPTLKKAGIKIRPPVFNGRF